jgi:hypothetical protein
MYSVKRPIRYTGPLPAIKARPVRAKRAAVAASAFEEISGCGATQASTRVPSELEEIRGVHVTTHADRISVSDGIYKTYRYKDRLAAAGGRWDGAAWNLPLGADVRAILDPHGVIAAKVAAANRPSWTCCAKAKVLSHKNKHYSCPEHTMYYEECIDAEGRPIKILYACSTKGGGCYTGN